jgi:hypothetical protein
MTCFNSLTGYLLLNEFTEEGKRKIIFKPNALNNRPYELIDLACGQCIGCRIDNSKQWALRCVHEASLYDDNCFITLTYDDDNINQWGSLVKKDFQNFMKRLRKRYIGTYRKNSNGIVEKISRIRYFHCGEYGEKLTRPHHHAILFNFCFRDLEFQKHDKGHNYYVSEELSQVWNKGIHVIGDVSMYSAAYIAKYCTKKVTGKKAQEHYKSINPYTGEVHSLEPEYITMSRRPGIGMEWFKKYSSDCYPKDFITEDGKKFKIPKFYDKLYEVENPMGFNRIKMNRRKEANKRLDERTLKRINAKHKIAISKANLYERKL